MVVVLLLYDDPGYDNSFFFNRKLCYKIKNRVNSRGYSNELILAVTEWPPMEQFCFGIPLLDIVSCCGLC